MMEEALLGVLSSVLTHPTHFLQLMWRTISLRIMWALGPQEDFFFVDMPFIYLCRNIV